MASVSRVGWGAVQRQEKDLGGSGDIAYRCCPRLPRGLGMSEGHRRGGRDNLG